MLSRSLWYSAVTTVLPSVSVRIVSAFETPAARLLRIGLQSAEPVFQVVSLVIIRQRRRRAAREVGEEPLRRRSTWLSKGGARRGR